MLAHSLLAVVFAIVMVVGIMGVFVVSVVRQDLDYKRRKKKYEEERIAARSQFAAEVDAILARQIARQKAEQPTITVPVTHKDKQDRRRIIKLET